jgi:membrane protein
MIGRIKRAYGVFKTAARSWSEDDISVHCAALAYYTVFSLAPVLVIAIAMSGVFFGDRAGRGEIFRALKSLLGDGGASAVESMIRSAAHHLHAGSIAFVIGLATLIFGASGVFQQLQYSLNSIWKVKTRPGCGVYRLFRQRLLSFSMVAVIGFILLVSMLVSAALTTVGTYFGGQLPGGSEFWHFVNFGISFAVVTLLFAAIFKILPDVKLRWRDVWVGSALTAFLFDVGKFLIGFYLGRSGISSTYGAAGSFVALLVWVFYSSAILFFGAEFTRAYATRGGERMPRKTDLVVFTDEKGEAA